MDGIEIEVPEYFICPISLQIMKDPVTAITGITYDRESIEHWLFIVKISTCPVTKQSLPADSDLTPNHMLRRLIQAWCIDNAAAGVDLIPTPKPTIDKSHFLKLVKDLQHPQLQTKTLSRLDFLAAENERNRKYMSEADVGSAVLSFIVACFRRGQVAGLEEALRIVVNLVRILSAESNVFLIENIDQIIESLTWVLCCEMDNSVKSHAVLVLKKIIQTASSSIVERLKPEFFQTIVGIVRHVGISQQGVNAGLQILFDVCSYGRNRIMMVESSSAVFELIELELETPAEKTKTELVLGILFHLCSCAEGRAQFLSHRGGVAVVSERILRASPSADDRAVSILSLICKFSGKTYMVIQEMLNVGAVAKLSMLLQVDSGKYLKEKTREILRSHADDWKNSPCIKWRS